MVFYGIPNIIHTLLETFFFKWLFQNLMLEKLFLKDQLNLRAYIMSGMSSSLIC